MEKEYFVGIDFGHGETAAWFAPMTGIGDSLKLRNSNSGKNDRALDSVVYYNKGNYCLHSPGGVVTRLKDKISNLTKPENKERKNAYEKFISLVFERLLELNDNILKIDEKGNTNFYLCIACPTRWNQKEKEDYVAFFNTALESHNVKIEWVIDESDAAFFSHIGECDIANECVLVIDYGSSTIDYTVIYKGKEISEKSWSNQQLGASKIEHYIRLDYQDKNFEQYQSSISGINQYLQGTPNEKISVVDCLDYECRKAKEETFKDNAYPDVHMFFPFSKYCNLPHPYFFNHECDLSQILGDGSMEKPCYFDQVRSDFETLKSRIETKINKKVDRIILSGGACVMKWVKDMVQEVFIDSILIPDEYPGFVVAKGIALYAQAQIKALEHLKRRVEMIAFSELYKKSDSSATNTAIKNMIPTVSPKIRAAVNSTGYDLVNIYCDFVRGLNNANKTFCHYVQDELEKNISIEVGQSISSVIIDVFNVGTNTSDIHITIVSDVLTFTEDNFKPNRFLGFDRSFYDHFRTWVYKATSKSLDERLDSTDLEKVVEKVSDSLCRWIDRGGLKIQYNNAAPAISNYSESICNQAKKEAERVFYEKQLFITTFA